MKLEFLSGDLPQYKYDWIIIYLYNTISRLESDLKHLKGFHRRLDNDITYQDYLDLIILECQIETYKTIFDDILKIGGHYDRIN